MPTSSQSQILSVVDYQLLQQQVDGHDGANRRSSINITSRRRSLGITTSQRYNPLHLPTINLYSMAHNNRKSSIQTIPYLRRSLPNDTQIRTDYRISQIEKYPTSININNNNKDSSLTDSDSINHERRSSLFDETTRRLLLLGTIRPSKTFYKDLPEDDVDHLMQYFQRMRTTNQKLTSAEINQNLETEYKSKIFFDSTSVTKSQMKYIEEIVEQYADQIRMHQIELVKLDDPIRFVLKQIDNEIPLITIPREYNDCFLTLITQTDSLQQSKLISKLVQKKLLEDIKANSLDISYFPGGINYEIPHKEINNDGQMTIETYVKLKKRLKNHPVWYFNGSPERKPNALLAILPPDSSIQINHQQLLECLYDRLENISIDENFDIKQRILSIEYLPLNCILDSSGISNQFIIDCESFGIKQQLMNKPLKINVDNCSIKVELRSYDEDIRREYEKFIKAEKYGELIRNHDEAIKRTKSKKITQTQKIFLFIFE